MMLPDTKARMQEQMGPPNPYARPKAKKPAPRRPLPAPSLSLIEAPSAPSPLSLAMPDPLELTPQLQGRQFLSTPDRSGARPGDTKINSLDLSQGMKTGKSRNSYMDEQAYKDLVQVAMNMPTNRALRGGIDDQQGMYEDVVRTMPQGMVDLTPLMAMTDAMTGSNFAGSYKAPDSFADRAKLLSGLQDKTQSSRERLAQLVMNETGGIKQGQDEQGYTSGLDESQKAGFAVPREISPRIGGLTPGNVAGAEKWIIGENQKMLKDFTADKSALDNLKRSLATGNFGDIRRSLAQAARVISGEKGVLTEGDLTRVLPRTMGMDWGQFATYVTSDPSFQIDPYILEGIKNAVAASELDLHRRYADKHQAFRDQLESSSTYGSLPSLPAIVKPNQDRFAPPAAPPVDTSYEDMMKGIRDQIKAGRKK